MDFLHFEDIWNEAESASKTYTDLDRKKIFSEMRKALDNLSDSDKAEEYNIALGDVLFGLCSLCAYLETKKSMEINSASALTEAIERKRVQTLDPDPE